MSTDTSPMLISAEELARLLDVPERTPWRLLSAGKLPRPLRIGRNTRWRRVEVTEWIDGDARSWRIGSGPFPAGECFRVAARPGAPAGVWLGTTSRVRLTRLSLLLFSGRLSFG